MSRAFGYNDVDQRGCRASVYHFRVVQEAMKAVKEMDKYRLDKAHLVRVYLVDDLDRLAQVPIGYQEPATASFDVEVLTQSRRFRIMRLCLVDLSVWCLAEAQWHYGMDDG